MIVPTRKIKKLLHGLKKRINRILAFMASIRNKTGSHKILHLTRFKYVEEAEALRKEYIKNLETSVLLSALIMNYAPTSIIAPGESDVEVRKKWRPFSEKKNLPLKGKSKCKHNNFKGKWKELSAKNREFSKK